MTGGGATIFAVPTMRRGRGRGSNATMIGATGQTGTGATPPDTDPLAVIVGGGAVTSPVPTIRTVPDPPSAGGGWVTVALLPAVAWSHPSSQNCSIAHMRAINSTTDRYARHRDNIRESLERTYQGQLAAKDETIAELRRRAEVAEAERDRLAAAQAAQEGPGATAGVSADDPSPAPSAGLWARLVRWWRG